METDFGSVFFKMLGSLILILAVIFGLFYIIKKTRGGVFAKNPLRLVGVLNLAPRRSVALVEFNGQWLVLGVTPDRITLLEKAVKPPEAPRAVDQAPGSGFQALLRHTLFKNSLKKTEQPEIDENQTQPDA